MGARQNLALCLYGYEQANALIDSILTEYSPPPPAAARVLKISQLSSKLRFSQMFIRAIFWPRPFPSDITTS